MATVSAYNNNWNYHGVTFNKSLNDMSDVEFQDALSKINTNKSRNNQLANAAGIQVSTNNTYANNRTSSGTQTSSNFGGDWTQGNSNFGFDQMKQQAKDMAAFQLENAGKQMQQSYDFRDKEANRNYGFQRGLSEQSYTQQRGINDQQNDFQRGMFQLQDNAKQNETRSARDAASRLYFGRARGNRRF